MLDALEKGRHQELVALNALGIVALAEILPGAPERQCLRTVDVVAASPQVQVRHGIVYGRRQADFYPVQRVDDLLEPDEREFDEVIDVNAGGLLDGLPEAAGPAVREAGVDLLDVAGGLSRLTGRAILWCAVQDRRHRVARDAQDDDLACPGRDVQHHDGVRSRTPDFIGATTDTAVDACPAV